MNTNDNGGPAFPTTPANYDDMDPAGEGMTLRDYFATHATDEDVKAAAEVLRMQTFERTGVAILPEGWRTTARYMHADAMLAERAKVKP